MSQGIEVQDKLSSADKIAWLLFCATCVYLVSLQPFVELIPGERGNVFAGFLCAITLGVAVLAPGSRFVRATRPEIVISLALLVLALASGLTSATPWSSFIRVLVVVSSGLGGFWCARILLGTESRQRTFVWLCAITLSGLIFLSLWGYQAHGKVDHYIFLNSHQIIHMTVLLLVGPLSLITSRKPMGTFLGIVLTGFGGAVLILAATQSQVSGVIVPLGAVLILTLISIFRARTMAGQLILLLMVAVAVAYFLAYWNPENQSHVEYQSYRVESYPFSLHVAMKKPFLGVGLRTPRDEFLDDYEVRHPAYSKEKFASELRTAVTPENAFLALLTGLGVPFFLLYCLGVGWLLVWLIKNFFRSQTASLTLRPWTLLVPLLGSLLHSLTTDTLMLPQLVWYFHLLLGLIPKPEPVPAEYAESWESIVVRAVGLIGALALGIFLGTQPYFAPGNLPKADAVHAFLKEVPVVKLLYYEKPKPAIPGDQPSMGTMPREGQGTYPATPDSRLSEIYGNLVVNIEGYKGASVDWAIMTILDNSKSMADGVGQEGRTKRDVALSAIDSVARAAPQGSKMALRAFSYYGLARKKSKVIPLRVSRVLVDWTDVPAFQLQEAARQLTFADENNLCAATSRSLQKDFGTSAGLKRRILVVTDGHRECSFQEALRIIEKEKMRGDLKVDVVAIDMSRSVRGPFTRLAAETGGAFVDLASRDDSRGALPKYLVLLAAYRPQAMEVLAPNWRHKALLGETVRLSPGSYTVSLPEIAGQAASKQTIKDVRILAGKTTVLKISGQEQELVIQ